MSYSTSIPNIGDFLAISQKQMLSNFQAINQTFFENHVGLTSEKNVGMHDVLTLRPQGSDPTTNLDQSAIYNKLDINSIPQLFFRPSTNQTPIQLSNKNLDTRQTGASDDAQSSFIAGPFTIYFGFINNCPDGQVITLLPSSNLIYVGLTTANPQGTIFLPNIAIATTIASNQFTVRYQFTPAPLTIYYMAVGK